MQAIRKKPPVLGNMVKVKLSLCLTKYNAMKTYLLLIKHHAMKMYGGAFLTLALDGG
jgi:hypothetical protein